jgi:hypothetical protein
MQAILRGESEGLHWFAMEYLKGFSLLSGIRLSLRSDAFN